MLFKIKSNSMHPLRGALPLPYVPARVTRGAFVAHKHSIAPPRCRTSQYRRTNLCPSQCLFGTILGALYFMVWNWPFLRAEPIFFPVGLICSFFFAPTFFSFLPSLGWLCGVGVFGLIECSHSLPTFHCSQF